MWQAIVVAGTAAVCGAVCTRFARDAAIRFGLIDQPDGRRKIQTRAVPLAGGIGVLAGAVIALALSLLLPGVAQELGSDIRRGLALLVAAVIIAIVGLADDARNLRPRFKILGQIAASLILIFPGNLLIERIAFFGFDIELDVMSVPFTLFWFLASINALNLLDGMDGLLGTVGFVVCGALAGIAFLCAHSFAGLIAAALAGSILGFLRYNLPPATVYLGDCGSMLIGLVVAALAIQASIKGPAMALVAPTAILILPLLDTSAAIVRRKLTGRGLAIPDRGHLHHVLQRSGMTIRRVLVLVTVLGLIAAGGALVSVYMRNDLIALLSSGAVALILVTGGLFGNAEVRLMKERTIAFLKSATGDRHHVETEVRLHGSAHWGDVWKDITARADVLNLQTVCLDVNAPVWHEDYHVRWDRVGSSAPPFRLWKAEIPLFGQGHAIGRLTVCGPRDEVPIGEKLALLSEIVDTAELRVAEVVQAGATRPPTPVLPSRPEPAATPA
jgi:UDP-GlcNAc:undecaprenyl-phosphate GlcNAc-1-phosphate transferase